MPPTRWHETQNLLVGTHPEHPRLICFNRIFGVDWIAQSRLIFSIDKYQSNSVFRLIWNDWLFQSNSVFRLNKSITTIDFSIGMIDFSIDFELFRLMCSIDVDWSFQSERFIFSIEIQVRCFFSIDLFNRICVCWIDLFNRTLVLFGWLFNRTNQSKRCSIWQATSRGRSPDRPVWQTTTRGRLSDD